MLGISSSLLILNSLGRKLCKSAQDRLIENKGLSCKSGNPLAVSDENWHLEPFTETHRNPQSKVTENTEREDTERRSPTDCEFCQDNAFLELIGLSHTDYCRTIHDQAKSDDVRQNALAEMRNPSRSTAFV